MENARGNCIKYGDNVDTDVIIPARYLAIQDRSLLPHTPWRTLIRTSIKR